jgi:hypothetical protein
MAGMRYKKSDKLTFAIKQKARILAFYDTNDMTACNKIYLLILIIGAQCGFAQAKPGITVNFTETEIFINDSKCFNYAKNGNDFLISDLAGKALIKGTIRKNLMGKFESTIIFLPLAKTFSNKKIIGRNDLIFAVANGNIIGKDCHIDNEKLKKFIEENNEQK